MHILHDAARQLPSRRRVAFMPLHMGRSGNDTGGCATGICGSSSLLVITLVSLLLLQECRCVRVQGLGEVVLSSRCRCQSSRPAGPMLARTAPVQPAGSRGPCEGAAAAGAAQLQPHLKYWK
jgi:hypothetical protein